MPPDRDRGPFRIIGVVIATFVFAFVFVLLAVGFGGAEPGSVLTLPFVVAVPIIAAALWYRVKRGS